MRGFVIRAFCVAGLLAFPASGALAGSVARAANPLDLTSYTTIVDQDTAPQTRLAGEFDPGRPVMLPIASYGPPVQSSYSAIGHLALLDDLSLDFGTGAGVAPRFDSYSTRTGSADDGLFFSAAAVDLPYVSLADGGSFASANLALPGGLRLTLGEASLAPGLGAYSTSASATVARMGGAPLPYDLRSANSLLAGVSWNFAPWGGIGLTGSQTSEHNGLLGNFSTDVRAADTAALDVSARVELGGGWMTTASFADAITKLDLKPGLGAPDDLRTRSYGLAVAKRGLFGNDAMGIAITRPAPGSAEDGQFALVPEVDASPQLFAGNHLLDSQAPETDFEVGYVTTFLDGSVALQTNAAYQVNFAGQSGTNAVSLLSRAKIKF